MRAAISDRYGIIDVVKVRDVDTPAPTGDEVLVSVQAGSINRADLDLIGPDAAFVRLFLGLRAPRHGGLGCDVAGVVESVRPAVAIDRQVPRDRVVEALRLVDQGPPARGSGRHGLMAVGISMAQPVMGDGG
jgi:NADPH:quinone reductase-like Zn-dependent oxidoreductase